MSPFQTANLRIEKQAADLALLVLNVAGRELNVLSRQVLADLDAALDYVAGDSALRRLVVLSAKPSFLAGADLHEFAEVNSPDEARFISAAGQRLFEKLEKLPIPS